MTRPEALSRWIRTADNAHRMTANAFAQARERREYDVWDWRTLTQADADFADRLLSELPGSLGSNTSEPPDAPGQWTAGDLVESRRCTPQCLLAVNGKCDCPCNGRWHGVLTSAEVDEAKAPPWYARRCYWAQSHLDERCPVVPAGVPAYNRHYRACQRAHVPFAIVQRRGQAWEMHFDAETEEWDSALSDDAAAIWEEILMALIRARRVRSGSGGKSLLTAYRVRSQAEAQVLGVIALELLCGNLDGARACLTALAEDGLVRSAR